LPGRRNVFDWRSSLERLHRGNRRLDDEGAGDAGDAAHFLGAVDQHLHRRRFVVGDALERGMRHQTADLLSFAVLLALVDEAARRAGLWGLQFVVGKGRRQQALAGEGERNARGVDRNPASAPLLGDVSSGSRAARWIKHQVTRVRRQ